MECFARSARLNIGLQAWRATHRCDQRGEPVNPYYLTLPPHAIDWAIMWKPQKGQIHRENEWTDWPISISQGSID